MRRRPAASTEGQWLLPVMGRQFLGRMLLAGLGITIVVLVLLWQSVGQEPLPSPSELVGRRSDSSTTTSTAADHEREGGSLRGAHEAHPANPAGGWVDRASSRLSLAANSTLHHLRLGGHDGLGDITKRMGHRFAALLWTSPSPQPSPSASMVPSPSALPSADVTPSSTPSPTPTASPAAKKADATGSVQHASLPADPATMERVKAMFDHAWGGYKKHAWGQDALRPVSRRGDNNFLGMGATVLDALDTMLIIGEIDEFRAAKEWVLDNLQFATQENINVFETTIRILGGLLAAWDLEGRTEPRFLDKARELADKLLVAFDSPSGIPFGTVGLRSGTKYNPAWAGGSSIAEVATLQLELEMLSAATGEPRFARASRRVMRALHEHEPSDALWPMWVSPETGHPSGGTVTLGARGDSAYEYMLKQWVLAGGLRSTNGGIIGSSSSNGDGGGGVGNPAMVGVDDVSGSDAGVAVEHEHDFFRMVYGMYKRSAKSIDEQLVQRCRAEPHLLFIAERTSPGHTVDKMDHLVCFAGAMYALGARDPADDRAVRDMEIAEGVASTCHQMYARTPSKLAPEIVRFRGGEDMEVDGGSKHCLLRPEAVESWFYMWRITGDEKYRQWGREMLEAIELHARVDSGGYSSIDDVTQVPVSKHRDHQESFFLAETLKYLYLLFTDGSVVSLDEWVFNTEAHPFRVFPPIGSTPTHLPAPLPVPFVRHA